MAKAATKARRKRKANKKRSNKGALLKGMSRRLPRTLLEDLAFKKGLQDIMRGYAGVYALYSNGQLYYVGLARDLYNRLRLHTRNKHKDKWDTFAIFRVNRVRMLKDMETLLLQVAQPPGNAVTGHLQKDADLTRILHKVLRENTIRLRQIRNALRAPN